MKIVLHIGTHKTGTSSIQNFFTTNKEKLLSQGVYYALGKSSIRNVNYVASQISYGKHDEVKKFFKYIYDDADKKNIKKIFISAESFYAMTGFFHILQHKKVYDYWDSESSFVSFLKDCLGEVDVEILIYLRRQDIFLESIYNQFVKQEQGFKYSIDNFYKICPEILDYDRHINLWKGIFPESKIIVKDFEQEKFDLINKLLVNELNIESQSDFIYPKKAINTRLNLDYLVFKRILNNMDVTISEAYVVSKIIMQLSRGEKKDMGDTDYTLISHVLLDEVINQCAESNESLVKYFFKNSKNTQLNFKKVSLEKKEIYPGLKITEGIRIYYKYIGFLKSPKVKLEIETRNIIRKIFSNFPFIEPAFRWLRKMNNKNRLRLEREGHI
jgi:N-acetylglutamate synthase-like GNAT family acetyltransferase